MENKKEVEMTKEELVEKTELVEEEALKADAQRRKKIIKKILVGTGIAAIIGGVIAATRSKKSSDSDIGFEANPETDVDETNPDDQETIEIEA